jgi:hypothetical protein
VASFLVGMLLADDDPQMAEGAARMRARIAKRIAVTPLGVLAPSQFWKHRNAICATWFCKHVRGKRGEDFWKSLAVMMSEAERALVHHCVLELDLGADALRLLFPNPRDALRRESLDDLDERVDEERYRALWGNWYGREEAFYVAAAEIVRPLRWGDVMRIGGSELALRARIATSTYLALMSQAIPERAKVGGLGITSMQAEASLVMTYSRFDPIELPNELIPLLAYFDGAKVDDARRRILDEHGIALEEDLVLKLLDFGVLVPA